MEELLLVDVKDAHGALWSVPASRIRLVKHRGSGAERYDKIVTDGDEELICVWGEDPAAIEKCLWVARARNSRIKDGR
jgi:hypothetical protein